MNKMSIKERMEKFSVSLDVAKKMASNGTLPSPEPFEDANVDEMFEAKLKFEKNRARLTEMQADEKAGLLIDAEKTYSEGRLALKTISKSLQQLADRVSPLIAELPEREVNSILKDEVNTMLKSIHEIFLRIGVEGEE